MKFFESKEEALWRKKSGKQIRVAYIAMEYLPHGDIFDFITNTGSFSEAMTRSLAWQLVEALVHMNAKGFANRDIKLENIMVGADFNLKLVDLGFATSLSGADGDGLHMTRLGSQSYMAPEIFLKLHYQAPEVDIFALGVVLFLLFTGNRPFKTATMEDLYYKQIARGNLNLFWQAHEINCLDKRLSPEFKDLISNMLSCNPYERPCLAEVVGHPWMHSDKVTSQTACR